MGHWFSRNIHFFWRRIINKGKDYLIWINCWLNGLWIVIINGEIKRSSNIENYSGDKLASNENKDCEMRRVAMWRVWKLQEEYFFLFVKEGRDPYGMIWGHFILLLDIHSKIEDNNRTDLKKKVCRSNSCKEGG